MISEQFSQLKTSQMSSSISRLDKKPCYRNGEDIDIIYNKLKEIRVFEKFNPRVIQQLSIYGFYEDLIPNVTLFRFGDIGHYWYAIISGQVKILVPYQKGIGFQHVATLHAGATFGESVLDDSACRQATAVTASFCELLCVHKNDFKVIWENHKKYVKEIITKLTTTLFHEPPIEDDDNISTKKVGTPRAFGSLMFTDENTATVEFSEKDILENDVNYDEQSISKMLMNSGVIPDGILAIIGNNPVYNLNSDYLPIQNPASIITAHPSARLMECGWVIRKYIMKNTPELIRDRTYHLITYPKCMAGDEMVNWLLESSPVTESREQAVNMWQAFIEEGIIYHVNRQFEFQDDYVFYRFAQDDPDNTKYQNQFVRWLETYTEESEKQMNDEKEPRHSKFDSRASLAMISTKRKRGRKSMEMKVLSRFRLSTANDSTDGEIDLNDIKLQTAVLWLGRIAPDAYLRKLLRKPSKLRTDRDVSHIYNELQNLLVFRNLSQLVRREVCKVVYFEAYPEPDTIIFHQGDESNAWYIILKGSVNIIIHGKGIVHTLYSGEDFGKFACVNNVARTATVMLNESDCHFLKVNKEDVIRIMAENETSRVIWRDNNIVSLIMDKVPVRIKKESTERNMFDENEINHSYRYLVTAGSPNKILEHLFETSLNCQQYDIYDETTINFKSYDLLELDPFLDDFLITYKTFISDKDLCLWSLNYYENIAKDKLSIVKSIDNVDTNISSSNSVPTLAITRKKLTRFFRAWRCIARHTFYDNSVIISTIKKLIEYFEKNRNEPNQNLDDLNDDINQLNIILRGNINDCDAYYMNQFNPNPYFFMVNNFDKEDDEMTTNHDEELGLKIIDRSNETLKKCEKKSPEEKKCDNRSDPITKRLTNATCCISRISGDVWLAPIIMTTNVDQEHCRKSTLSERFSSSSTIFAKNIQSRFSYTSTRISGESIGQLKLPNINSIRRSIVRISPNSRISKSLSPVRPAKKSSLNTFSPKKDQHTRPSFLTRRKKKNSMKNIQIVDSPKNVRYSSENNLAQPKVQIEPEPIAKQTLQQQLSKLASERRYINKYINICDIIHRSQMSDENEQSEEITEPTNSQSKVWPEQIGMDRKRTVQLIRSQHYTDLDTVMLNYKPIRKNDKVILRIFCADHTQFIVRLPVIATSQDILNAALSKNTQWIRSDDKEQMLLTELSSNQIMRILKNDQMNCIINENGNVRLFFVNKCHLDSLVPLNEQLGLSTYLTERNTTLFNGTFQQLVNFSSREIAYVLSCREYNNFVSIHEHELLWYTIDRLQTNPHNFIANLNIFLRGFNEISNWIATEMLLTNKLDNRVHYLRKFIKIAYICRNVYGNLSTFVSITLGLKNLAVGRLTKTWDKLGWKFKKLFTEMENIIDPSRSYLKYRRLLREMINKSKKRKQELLQQNVLRESNELMSNKLTSDTEVRNSTTYMTSADEKKVKEVSGGLNSITANSQIIPYVQILLRDLQFTHEGKKTYYQVEDFVHQQDLRVDPSLSLEDVPTNDETKTLLINFEKMRYMASMLRQIRLYRTFKLNMSPPSNNCNINLIRQYFRTTAKFIDDSKLLLRISYELEKGN
ncbi:hypothetical protein SNEBB_010057 [Seison nebaliae]|nr:hypothetical protein SNEBB_010057 [Seison nebaliae]